jgi:hypothetical protein
VIGVCARVTVLALNYLKSLGVSASNPATDKQERTIYWSASAQRSGMVLVGPPDPGAEDSAEWAIIERLGRLVEESIEQDAHMQVLPMPSMRTFKERITFADSIKAELVILLDIRRDEDGPAGIQTHCFSRAGADSDVGAPLASYIGEETAWQTGATYLGARAEDSQSLMAPMPLRSASPSATSETRRTPAGSPTPPQQRHRAGAYPALPAWRQTHP